MVPGEIVRAAVFARVESSYQIRREEIPEKLEPFRLALLDLLCGTSGRVIERLIAKYLYKCLKLDFPQNAEWTLTDYVNHARHMIEGNGGEKQSNSSSRLRSR
jgi:DNA-binding winged helix-turn-helix (wHTH) protein